MGDDRHVEAREPCLQVLRGRQMDPRSSQSSYCRRRRRRQELGETGGTVRRYFEFIKFSHTVFALPWALAAMLLAARDHRGWPGWRVFLLILGCMVTARTAAMGFNRIADREIDALNPRTKMRHLPAGQISPTSAWVLVCLSAVGFVACAAAINPLTLWLA